MAYNAKNIAVLEGLEPVRKRLGMFLKIQLNGIFMDMFVNYIRIPTLMELERKAYMGVNA